MKRSQIKDNYELLGVRYQTSIIDICMCTKITKVVYNTVAQCIFYQTSWLCKIFFRCCYTEPHSIKEGLIREEKKYLDIFFNLSAFM